MLVSGLRRLLPPAYLAMQVRTLPSLKQAMRRNASCAMQDCGQPQLRLQRLQSV